MMADNQLSLILQEKHNIIIKKNAYVSLVLYFNDLNQIANIYWLHWRVGAKCYGSNQIPVHTSKQCSLTVAATEFGSH